MGIDKNIYREVLVKRKDIFDKFCEGCKYYTGTKTRCSCFGLKTIKRMWYNVYYHTKYPHRKEGQL